MFTNLAIERGPHIVLLDHQVLPPSLSKKTAHHCARPSTVATARCGWSQFATKKIPNSMLGLHIICSPSSD